MPFRNVAKYVDDLPVALLGSADCVVDGKFEMGEAWGEGAFVLLLGCGMPRTNMQH